MTDPATLLELALACERAEGPSRELDARIAIAAAGWTSEASGKVWRGPNKQLKLFDPPNFTGSLDIAVSLVPKWWRFTLESGPKTKNYALAQGPLTGKFAHLKRGAWASGAALAICVAALRARAAQEKADV